MRKMVCPQCKVGAFYVLNGQGERLQMCIRDRFWTTHIYRCNNIKLLNLHIFAPAAPVKACLLYTSRCV